MNAQEMSLGSWGAFSSISCGHTSTPKGRGIARLRTRLEMLQPPATATRLVVVGEWGS
jgi:hypothetical protein